MNTDETTIAMDRMWIDCTVGMIQDTFWIVRLSGVSLSHCANECRVIEGSTTLAF